MSKHLIELSAEVEPEKRRSVSAVRGAFEEIMAEVTGSSPALLHEVEARLFGQVMRLGVLLIGVWLVHRLPSSVPETLRDRGGWFRFRGMASRAVRTRFGPGQALRPEYTLVHGDGPPTVAPFDRQIGLAAGRMSLGVHLGVCSLVARMPFQTCHDVMKAFGGYVPSTRAMHGIVDGLGPLAAVFLEELEAPEDDGEIVVVEVDHKGAPHMGPEEHRRRRQKHRKQPRGLAKREGRRARRLRKETVRKKTGDKSKNARMAAIGVVYTLRRLPDGSVEGPINRRVFGTFKGTRRLFTTLAREAKKRGYGHKETIFLADGETQLWNLRGEFFPKARPCLDWFHLCEYLWKAGGAVHRSKTKAGKNELKRWVQDRKQELRSGQIDEVLTAVEKLYGQIGKSGPGTKSRRERVGRALTYIANHREFMPYKELVEQGLVIGTGNIEGAAKYIGSRLDGSGMRWSKERAEHVLALRCVLASGEWKGFAKAAQQRHEACADPWVPRVTPSRPMTPHKAVKKAA